MTTTRIHGFAKGKKCPFLGLRKKSKEKGKYTMTKNKNELKSLGVSLTKQQWERCDKLAEEHGKKSRNAFIREAVDFYCAWLE